MSYSAKISENKDKLQYLTLELTWQIPAKLGNKINLFVLAKPCYSKHLVYNVQRQRREHAIKVQCVSNYNTSPWPFETRNGHFQGVGR